MPKVDIKKENPELYERVSKEQRALREKCSHYKVARLCPYCGHKVTTVYKGDHGYSDEKCTNCGENVLFPPISFRMATSARR